MLTVLLLTAAAAATPWEITGVLVGVLGLLGAMYAHAQGWLRLRRRTSIESQSLDLSMYTHLVDDLQTELRRVHDNLENEHQQSAEERRRLGIEIERKGMEIEALRQQILSLERDHLPDP